MYVETYIILKITLKQRASKPERERYGFTFNGDDHDDDDDARVYIFFNGLTLLAVVTVAIYDANWKLRHFSC